MALVIQGFPSTFKVPGAYGETKFGASAINISSIPLKCLLVGLKTSAGSLTPDIDVVRCQSIDEADALAGQGSELGNMAYFAINALKRRGLSADLYLAAVTPAGGAAAAAATALYAGTATANGTLYLDVGGFSHPILVRQGDTAATVAAAAVAILNQNVRNPTVATLNTATVTVTCKTAGARGNEYILYKAGSVAGITVTLGGGGTAVGSTGIRLTGGTGVESLTTFLTNTFGERYPRSGVAQNDAVSAAAYEAQIDAKAAPLEGRMEHFVMGWVGTLSAAITIAQSTLNNERGGYVWFENSEVHSSAIAAVDAAIRTAIEGLPPGLNTGPNTSYDDFVLPGLVPQRNVGERASITTQDLALNNGVTPLKTVGTEVAIVRAVTTHSRSGSTPDYRTLDTAEAVVPDFIREDLGLHWTTVIKPNNPYVRPEPADGEPPVPAGVMTPTRMNAEWVVRLRLRETQNVITQVTQNLPQTEYDSDGKRLMSAVPVVPLPHQHQVGISVRQVAVTV